MKFYKKYALIIVLIYTFISGLWIIFLDRILAYFVHDLKLYAQIQTYKGWFYVVATALLLYLLIRAYVTRLETYERELRKERDYNRLLFEKSVIGLALCRMDGTLLDVNESYAKNNRQNCRGNP